MHTFTSYIVNCVSVCCLSVTEARDFLRTQNELVVTAPITHVKFVDILLQVNRAVCDPYNWLELYNAYWTLFSAEKRKYFVMLKSETHFICHRWGSEVIEHLTTYSITLVDKSLTVRPFVR